MRAIPGMDIRYPLDLIEKVTRVSVETVEVLKGLPELGI